MSVLHKGSLVHFWTNRNSEFIHSSARKLPGSNLQIAALSHVCDLLDPVQHQLSSLLEPSKSSQSEVNSNERTTNKKVSRFGPMNVNTRTQKMMKSTALQEPLMSPNVVQRM